MLEKGHPGQTYNIGGHCEKTNLEVVKTVCAILDELVPDSPVLSHAALITKERLRPVSTGSCPAGRTSMKIIETSLPGVLIIEPAVFGDTRGFFMETWNEKRYAEVGLPASFVQDNLSFLKQGTLRGLHFQHPNAQGKLIFVLEGEVFDVAVDIRDGSPTSGQWVGVTLSADNNRQVYLPEGFAHGFWVTSETALFAYKCTDFYNPQAEGGIVWNDPDLGIAWPNDEPILSEKDRNYPRLKELPPGRMPQYRGVDR
ncbi:dTDP-4-dehydrorhamnose 3,5-epimerase [Thermodesulfovibrionales bacterium]|nr:dTDP-4-dehydrorhamnose 3,5-epimerase [Thermodesulfovibrionales bacterium]